LCSLNDGWTWMWEMIWDDDGKNDVVTILSYTRKLPINDVSIITISIRLLHNNDPPKNGLIY